jgi:hypothetical protein
VSFPEGQILAQAATDLVNWSVQAEAAAGVARSIVGTAFVPASLRVLDDRNRLDIDATLATVTAALLTGQELGFSPMASLRSIVIIPPGSGTPALLAAALRALVLHRGHEIWVVESTSTRAVVRGRRAGFETVQESVWTIDRARALKLRSFGDPNGQWQRQPANMLVARATAEVARWIAADAMMGLPYIVEEFEDGAEADSAPGAGDNGPAALGQSAATAPRRPPARRGARQPARARGSVRPVPALPPSPVPPPAGDGESGQPGEGAPAAEPVEPISASQRAALWAGLKKLGLTDRDEALATVSRWISRDITSSNALSRAEAGVALTALGAEEVRRAARERAEEAQTAAEASQDEEGGDDAAS